MKTRSIHLIFSLFFIGISLFPASANAASATLSISANSTIVSPGGVTTVTVTYSGSGLDGVLLSCQQPLSCGGTVLTNPGTNQFQVSVPSTAPIGIYKLIALGSTAGQPGVSVSSPAIQIEVINGNLSFVSLKSDPASVVLAYPGAEANVTISATGNDGSQTNVTGISSLQIADSTIATAHGLVIEGLKNGQTSMTITVVDGTGKQLTLNVPIVVEGSQVRGDLNSDGQIDIDDINLLQMSLNQPASGPNDPRDLNHDGVINALDARILTTLCTYPRCATHQ